MDRKMFLVIGCSQSFGLLHGMYDWVISWADPENDTEINFLDLTADELSEGVIEDYSNQFEDMYETDDEMYDNEIGGFWVPIKEGVLEEEVADLIDSYGLEDFMERYCD